MTDEWHDEAIRIHDKQAHLFDEGYRRMEEDPYDSAFTYSRKKINEFLDERLDGLPRPVRLLDVGCGTGDLMRRWSDRGMDVVGCDGSAEMIRHAASSTPRLPLVRADVERLPFRTNSVDVALSIEVMRYLRDESRAVREICRVLTPGGFALITFAPAYNLNLFPLINKVSSRRQIGNLTKVPQRFRTAARVEQICRAAGFAEVEVQGRFFGPFAFLQRLSRPWTSRTLRRWERTDDRIAAAPTARNFANLFVVCARKP